MIEAIGWLAVLLTAAQQIPQVVRTVRTGVVAGVSPEMFALMVAQGGAWIGYSAREGLAQPIIVNVVLISCAVLMLRLLVRGKAPRVIPAIVAIFVLLVIEAVVFAVAPTNALGLLATVLAFALLWPQVLVALRSQQLAGLSVSSWLLSVSNTVLWVIFGVAKEATLLWLSAGHGLLMSLVILGRMAYLNRVHAPTLAIADNLPNVTRLAERRVGVRLRHEQEGT